ncbi:MAG TPA: hypothetical protein VMR17_06960, partial [Xanthobacteraceae bacterium]|nr:hypothetical protein [Xanthobacteraceae bacterium]
KPFIDTPHEIPSERINDLISTYMRKASWHFGEGGFNPSTIAWVLAQVERQIASLDFQSK